MVDVSLVSGMVRYDNVFKSLDVLGKTLKERIAASSHIVIMPNLLHIEGCDTQTHVDTVKAILDFLGEFTNKKITIAHGSFSDEDVFHIHDYHNLFNDYSVRFLNLNIDKTIPIMIGKRAIEVSKKMIESDFRVSVTDFLVRPRAFGTIPNIILGSVSSNQKEAFYKSTTYYTDSRQLLPLLRPQLAVIDGFDTLKQKTTSSLAISSKDALAADTLASKYSSYKQKKLTLKNLRVLKSTS